MKLKFTHAIVKEPGRSMVNGITTADLGLPFYEKALEQHHNYTMALKQCGVDVTILKADDQHPDSCFIEDTALLTPRCGIITLPGAETRKGETVAVKKALEKHYNKLYQIEPPGTIEGGDIMMVGNVFYIGLSKRTNAEGARQIINILEHHQYQGITVTLKEMLHLKTGVSYLENNTMVITGEFLSNPLFEKFNKIIVSAGEQYSANCVWVNGTVLIPDSFPETRKKIENAGYKTIAVDVSEFQKLDGGLSCLSLRF